MTSTALAQKNTDQPEPKPDKPKRIPKAIIRACELLATGECKTITAAATRVGITREWLGKMLSRSHVQVFMARKCRETIGAGTLRASTRLVELIDANSEHVAAQVSERILTSEGILKSDQRSIAVNVDVRAGFVLDLREEQPSLTPGMRTIDANPLIDNAPRSSSPAPDDD